MAIMDHEVMFHRKSDTSRVVDFFDMDIGKGKQCKVTVQCIDEPPDGADRTLTLQQSDLAGGPFEEVMTVAYNPANDNPLEFHIGGNDLKQFGQLNIDAGSPVTMESSVILDSGQTNK